MQRASLFQWYGKTLLQELLDYFAAVTVDHDGTIFNLPGAVGFAVVQAGIGRTAAISSPKTLDFTGFLRLPGFDAPPLNYLFFLLNRLVI